MKSHVGVFVTVDEKKPRLGGVMPALHPARVATKQVAQSWSSTLRFSAVPNRKAADLENKSALRVATSCHLKFKAF